MAAFIIAVALKDPLFWAMGAVLVPAIGLIAASVRSIYGYFTKNRIDRLEMYVQLVDDLQEELRRLRDNQNDERESNSDRIRELALLVERQMQEITSLNQQLQNRKES